MPWATAPRDWSWRTGATDGIGLETAKLLAAQGHTLLLHGRSNAKLESAARELGQIDGVGITETYRADLSNLPEVELDVGTHGSEERSTATIDSIARISAPKLFAEVVGQVAPNL